ELAGDPAADRGQLALDLALDEVDDRAVVGLLGVDHRELAEPAAVAELPAGLGIERGAVEHDRRAGLAGRDRDDLGVEPPEVGIVVVQAVGHRLRSITSPRWRTAQRSASQSRIRPSGSANT